MVEVSKHLFDQTCRDIDCHILLHYYDSNCWTAFPETFRRTCIGSARFYAIVYLVQILMRGRKMRKKEEWYKIFEYYVRSTAMGICIGTTTSIFGCIARRMMGNKFHYHTYLWIPNMINGLFIFMEPAKRRGLVINLFVNLLIEYWIRTLQRDNYITMTRSKQTLLFMIGSAFLFYLMRLEGDKEQRTPLFWLFTPEKVRRKSTSDSESENVCPHNGPCSKHILMGYSTYFGVGLAISLARVLLPKIMTPLKALSSIRGKHFKMALFFGGYIGIYRAVICYLCRSKGCDSALFALPAGYLAGLSFLFNPNLGMSIASATAAAKLYSTILYDKKILPTSVPLPELLFCISQGTLYHARFMHADVCPGYVFNLMKTVSNGITETLYENFLEIIKKTL